MIFHPTSISGCFLVESERIVDERGYFARTFCAAEFADVGIDPNVAQCSISRNARAGTVRGLHYQMPPYEETKLVRCTAGRIFDVAVDLRQGSPTFLRHHVVELTERDTIAFLLPPLVAHGFMTLEPESEVSYQISAAYEPSAATGVRWDDPTLEISWPRRQPAMISDRDRSLPLVHELFE